MSQGNKLVQIVINSRDYLCEGKRICLSPLIPKHQVLSTICLQKPTFHVSEAFQYQQVDIDPLAVIVKHFVDELTIGKSFYLKFLFTNHYIYVDETNELKISEKQKSLFKLLSNQINAGDNIEFSKPYQLILSELNSFNLHIQNGNLKYGLHESFIPIHLEESVYSMPSYYSPINLYNLQVSKYLSYINFNEKKFIDASLTSTKHQMFMRNTFIFEKIGVAQPRPSNDIFSMLFSFSEKQNVQVFQNSVYIRIANSYDKKRYVSVNKSNRLQVSERKQVFNIIEFQKSAYVMIQHNETKGYLSLMNQQLNLQFKSSLSTVCRVTKVTTNEIQKFVPYFLLDSINELDEQIIKLLQKQLSSMKLLIQGNLIVREMLEDGILQKLQKLCENNTVQNYKMIQQIILTMFEINPVETFRQLLNLQTIFNQFLLSQHQHKIVLVTLGELQNPLLVLKTMQSILKVLDTQSLQCFVILRQACRIIKLYKLEHRTESQIIFNFQNTLTKNMSSKVTQKLLVLLETLEITHNIEISYSFIKKLLIQETLLNQSLSIYTKFHFMEMFCKAYPASELYIPTIFNSQHLFTHPTPPLFQDQSFKTYHEDVLAKHCRFQTINDKLFAIYCAGIYITYGHPSQDQIFNKIKCLANNINTFTYESDQFSLFFGKLFNVLEKYLTKYLFTLVKNVISYQSFQFSQQQKISKVQQNFIKVKQYFDESIHINLIWHFLETNKSLNNQQLIINLLKVISILYSPSALINYFFGIFTVVQQPTKQYIYLMENLLEGQYILNPQSWMRRCVQCRQKLTSNQIISLKNIFIHNKIQKKITLSQNKDLVYQFVSIFASVDFIFLLQRLENSHSPSQIKFLHSIVISCDQILSDSMYKSYQSYFLKMHPKKYNSNFFNLLLDFIKKCPKDLQIKFCKNYEFYVLKQNIEQIQFLFLKKIQKQMIILLLDLFLVLQNRRYQNQQKNYQQDGQTQAQQINNNILVETLFIYSDDDQVKSKLLLLIYQKQNYPYNIKEFMKSTNTYIHNELKRLKNPLKVQQQYDEQVKELNKSNDYVNSSIYLLKVRQKIVINNKNTFTQNELITIEGTNKLLSFEIVEMLHHQLAYQKNMIQNLQWLEVTYQINLNLDQIQMNNNQMIDNTIDIQQLRRENYLKKLQVSNLQLPFDNLSKIITEIMCVTHLMVIKNSPNQLINSLLVIILSIVIHLQHNILSLQDIKLLSEILVQCVKQPRYKNVVHIIQQIIIKTILRKGKIQSQYQELFQSHVVKNYQIYLTFFDDISKEFSVWCNFATSMPRELTIYTHFSLYQHVKVYTRTIIFFTILSKSLNFQFKGIFNYRLYQRKLPMTVIIDNLVKCIEHKHYLTAQHLQLINCLMKGPITKNINSCLKAGYQDFITPLLNLDAQWGIRVRKNVVQAHRIMIQYKKVDIQVVALIQNNIVRVYKQLSDDYSRWGNKVDNVIHSYGQTEVQFKKKNEIQLFNMSLQMFFMIVQVYSQMKDETIKQLTNINIKKKRLSASYNKKLKIFYQIYNLLKQTFLWIFGKICRFSRHQYKKSRDEEFIQKKQKRAQKKSREMGYQFHKKDPHLIEALQFFVRNTASIQIVVSGNIVTEHFLLLRQSHCYNTSIRKQLHRQVGVGKRVQRLTKFIQIVDFIILRLQIQKNIISRLEKWKPIQLIVVNRQLWKSLNFLCAVVLNFTYLKDNLYTKEQFDAVMNMFKGISFLLCIFLFMVYFFQSLPLKLKILRLKIQQNQNIKGYKKMLRGIKNAGSLVNDKTLWIGSIYFFVLALSFYQNGFLSILMLDFFVRFKVSRKVTQIISRPFTSIVLVLLFIVQLIYLYTVYESLTNTTGYCGNLPACIQENIQVFYGLDKEVVLTVRNLQLNYKSILNSLFRMMFRIVYVVLMVGILLFQKRHRDLRNKQAEQILSSHCFICNANRSDVDRQKNDVKGFYQHIEKNHNLWNYVYYLIYLKNKRVEDLSINQSMVLEQVKMKKIDWLPDRINDLQ